MAEYKIVNGELAKEELVGDILDGANMLEATRLELSRHQARKAKAEAEIVKLEAAIADLETESKKLDLPVTITDEEKIKLVMSGIKLAKDFPGDDWLSEYQPK